MAEYCKANGTVLQILRLGHIYGAGEEAYKKLIPETIRQVLDDKRPVLYNGGLEKRSYLHISDCVKAIWRAVELRKDVYSINIVSSRACSVKTSWTIIAVSGKAIEPVLAQADRPGRDFVFDNAKMRAHLCDEAIALEAGLRDEYARFRRAA